MTISQSRYGMNAEVGRNSSRPPKKDSKFQDAALASAGVAAAGGGIAGYGHGAEGRVNNRLVEYRNRMNPLVRELKQSRERYIQINKPRGNNGNFGVHPVNREEVERLKRVMQTNVDNIKNLNGERVAFRVNEAPKMLARGRFLTRAGLGMAAVGAAGAGVATAVGERRRGTSGYRRPTRAEFLSARGR